MNTLQALSKMNQLILEADAILIGAGSGLSAAAGLTYSGKRFEDNFADFIAAYDVQDMYSAGFYPFDSLEAYWGYWCRHIYLNRYLPEAGVPYQDLLNLIQDKKYFVITTNVDHQFQKAGFNKEDLFYTQGDYGLFQCSKACHNQTYENQKQIEEMIEQEKNLKIPSDLVPYCDRCGEPMTVNLRVDNFFVEDAGWQAASKNYQKFLENTLGKKLLLIELGVGMNTPVIIKYPFWKITGVSETHRYITLNQEKQMVPQDIQDQTLLLTGDIRDNLKMLTTIKNR